MTRATKRLAVPLAATMASMLILASACGGGGASQPAATTKPAGGATGNVAAGQTVFQQNCNSCHPNGDLGTGPALKGRNLPPAQVQAKVRQGGGAMPAFSASQINDQQLADVAAYVSQLK